MKIVIDGTIGKDYWGDDDTIISAQKVRDWLSDIGENEELIVEINSGGGSVMEGIVIRNILASHKGNVEVHIVGMCASIATHLALGANTVKAHDNAVFMIHNVSSWAGGDHKALRKVADTVEGLTKLLSKAYVKKTGKSEKDILKMMDEESWFYGAEIKEQGFIDELIATEDNSSNRSELVALAQETWNATADFVKAKTKEDEHQEAVAFLQSHKPTNKGKINALNARLKLILKEINNG